MKMNLTGAIEILKLHKHTTDKFRHSIGDKYVSDAIDTVITELEKPLPTDVELASKISKLVHNECANAPHDIGLKVVELIRKEKTYTAEDMKSAWESGCLVGCEQENDIIYNREKSNYLTFERWIEGRNRNDSRNS